VYVGFDLGFSFVDSVSGTSTTTIPVGTTVEWVWQGTPHSTTSGTCTASNCVPDFTWDSGIQNNLPFTFTYTFNTANVTYPYFCRVHGVSMGMIGTVIVNPPATTLGVPARQR
jgi:plastocyanin